MKVQIRSPGLKPGRIPDRAEIRPAQRGTLRADEYQTPCSRLSEPLQMPSQLGNQLGWDSHSAATSTRFRRFGTKRTTIQLGCRLHDPDLAGLQIDMLTAQPDQLAPTQTREGSEQHHGPIANWQRVGNRDHKR